MGPPKIKLGHVTQFEFRRYLWHQKTRVQVLLRGIICVILHLAVLIQYLSVSDTQTYTMTHNDGIYRATIASRGKKISFGSQWGQTSDWGAWLLWPLLITNPSNWVCCVRLTSSKQWTRHTSLILGMRTCTRLQVCIHVHKITR